MWQLVTPHLPSAERWMPERVVPSRCPARGTVHPHLGWDFPLQLNLETLLQTGVEVHFHGDSKPHQVALKIKYHRHRVTPPSSIKELSFDSGECVDESKRKKISILKIKSRHKSSCSGWLYLHEIPRVGSLGRPTYSSACRGWREEGGSGGC